MIESGRRDLLLHDPLSDVTRKERRMLLATSILGIAVVKTGLVPSKISALGIEFAKSDQDKILMLLAMVVLYFLIAFFIYATSDFLAWRRSLNKELADKIIGNIRKKTVTEIPYPEEFVQEALRGSPYGNTFELLLPRPVSIIRAIFEFLLPLLIGNYVFWILVS